MRSQNVRQDTEEGGTWEGREVGDGRREIRRGEIGMVVSYINDM